MCLKQNQKMLTELTKRLPSTYVDVCHLREECNDVLYNLLELSHTKNLKNYVDSKDDIRDLAKMLYDHVYEHMHEKTFYSPKD